MIKTVKLNNLRFYARHGYFPEEQKAGNIFILNISVGQIVNGYLTDNLSKTIDYVQLYEISKKEMDVTSKLLEDVLQRILNQIEQRYHSLANIFLSIKKQSPPFGGNCESSEVNIKKEY